MSVPQLAARLNIRPNRNGIAVLMTAVTGDEARSWAGTIVEKLPFIKRTQVGVSDSGSFVTTFFLQGGRTATITDDQIGELVKAVNPLTLMKMAAQARTAQASTTIVLAVTKPWILGLDPQVAQTVDAVDGAEQCQVVLDGVGNPMGVRFQMSAPTDEVGTITTLVERVCAAIKAEQDGRVVVFGPNQAPPCIWRPGALCLEPCA